jgi:dTDP-4-dehydrorhamnose 3,5-epimerase
VLSFRPTEIPEVVVVETEPSVDARGFFARTWCEREFREYGLRFVPMQASVSFSTAVGTLRGLHYQAEPSAEAKLVRCTAGSIFDVAVDVRPASATFCRWVGVELSASNRRSLFIPEGFAHGFQTLVEATEVLYLMSQPYEPDSRRGIRWDDPALSIEWPETAVRVISDRDQLLPRLGLARGPSAPAHDPPS